MTLAKVLLISLAAQLFLFVLAIQMIYSSRSDDWDILALYPAAAFVLFGIANLVLFVIYTVQWVNHKFNSYSPWILIMSCLVLGLTVCAPKIIDWADGPTLYDAYGRPLPGQ